MRLIRYLGLVGLAVFFYIVYSIGVSQIIESFSRLNPFIFLAALLLFFPIILLKGAKQAMLVNAFAVRLSLLDSAKIWLIGFFFSTISPGRLGDLVKGLYFARKTGVSTGKGVTAIVIERFLDIAMLFIFSISGFAAISFYFFLRFDLFFSIVLFFAGFLFLAFILTKKAIMLFLLRPFYRYFVPVKFKGKVHAGFTQFFEGIAVYKAKKAVLAKATALTAIVWVFAISQYFLIAYSLQLDVPFLFLFAVMPIVELLSVLPIAFSGIGTREASLVFFLSFVGISANSAVSFSLLILFSGLLLALGGFVLMQGEKKVMV